MLRSVPSAACSTVAALHVCPLRETHDHDERAAVDSVLWSQGDVGTIFDKSSLLSERIIAADRCPAMVACHAEYRARSTHVLAVQHNGCYCCMWTGQAGRHGSAGLVAANVVTQALLLGHVISAQLGCCAIALALRLSTLHAPRLQGAVGGARPAGGGRGRAQRPAGGPARRPGDVR